MKRKKVKTIMVLGRKWFQRTYGNTYHTAQVFVDGESVFKSGEQYGYGDQYLQTAREWLEGEGYLPGIEDHESLWRYCKIRGITLGYEAVRVGRERDL